MYDVAIAGASIAGSATALHLARSGYSVVLLDRARFPRRKACGEGLMPAGVRALQEMDVLDRIRPWPLEAVRFSSGRHEVEAPIEALGVRREELDAAILAQARVCGVSHYGGVHVRGMATEGGRVRSYVTDQGPVYARAFVAADGLHSPMRRQANLDDRRPGERFGVSAHVAIRRPLRPAIDVTFGEGHERYITPVGEHEANVAMLMRRDQARRFAGRTRAAFMELVKLDPALAGAELLDEPRFAGPFPRDCSRAWRANLALVGDAAGFFDGISGEGMSAALRSARLCAVGIDQYLATGSYQSFRDYDRGRRDIVRNANLVARLSLTAGRHQWSANLAVWNLSRRPETFARLVKVNAGEAPLSSLRLKDVSALLFGL